MRRRASIRVIILRVLFVMVFIGVVLNAVYTPSVFKDSSVKSGLAPTPKPYDVSVDPTDLIEQLRQGKNTFDWNDWIDLHKIELYENKELDPKMYPYLVHSEFEQLAFPRTKQSNQHEVAMMGRIYCKHYLPAPMRVIVLPTIVPGGSHPDTKAEEFFVTHEDENRRHRQYGHDEPTNSTVMEFTTPLVANLTLDTDPSKRLAVTLDPQLFNWNAYEVAGTETYHRETILQAIDGVSSSTKHFYECALRSDPMGYGGHYDWRFFRGVENYAGHTAAIHALARAWQLFAEAMGISYWYAHGSLIGWYWNGFTLPWDPDVDIQMPVMELNRLAKTFNRTLVVQTAPDGTAHKYLVDVGPWYVDRTPGNHQNVIDARFIDVDTGVYMDITGLAYIRRSAPIAMCKNRHRVHVNDVSPMRRTNFEGAPAYVPKKYNRLLSSEYERWEFPRFGRWRFKKSLRVWELEMTCAEMLRKFPNAQNKVFCYPREMIDNCDTSSKTGSCNKFVLAEYDATKNITAAHDEEMKLWSAEYKNAEEQLKVANVVDRYYAPFHNGTTEPVDDDFEMPVIVLDEYATATFDDYKLSVDPTATGFVIKMNGLPLSEAVVTKTSAPKPLASVTSSKRSASLPPTSASSTLSVDANKTMPPTPEANASTRETSWSAAAPEQT